MTRGPISAPTGQGAQGAAPPAPWGSLGGEAGALRVEPLFQPPDPRLFAHAPAHYWLRAGLVPWRRIGAATIVLTSRPDEFARHRQALTEMFGTVRMGFADAGQVERAVHRMGAAELRQRAETRVAARESCRDLGQSWAPAVLALLTAMLATALIVVPAPTVAGLSAVALLLMVPATLLKLAAALLATLPRPVPAPGNAPVPARLPVISLLVPLYHERQIAGSLLKRLAALDYPADRLDICLVLEDDDMTTRHALLAADLPPNARTIVVPRGTVKTKPRALNFALDFARGSIIGVYDAEDAPAPDQLRKVVAQFAASPMNVACLQGMLDYYNDRSNWLARCFTLEYAGWFRVILPGLARLGLVLPLGGTTLFFRRHALEALGGWDAHNVTEDADLGVRLARHGLRTALLDSVTEEEANARAWPWVKQRSRWLKGYGLTWGTHMRRPWRLWRDLGTWRFLGVQVLFLGTLGQVVLAPVLWSFWLIPLGVVHPVQTYLPVTPLILAAALMPVASLTTMAVAALGARAAGKGWLMAWIPTLGFYYPLATLAAFKGLSELVYRPFHWDKTNHGIFTPTRPRG